jgi:fibronectin-binding autotransporter adhesin
MKKTSCAGAIKCFLVGAIVAFAASGHTQAQAQIFWNEDNSTGTDLQSGTFSADEGGLFATTFKDNIAEGDLVFSSDLVGDEAQTLYLAGNYKPGTGYVVNGIEFNHGSITIEDDPNHTGSQLIIGTDGITMDEGTGDASVSSPTLYVYGAQSWNNNSSANLTVGGTIEGANSSDELTFAGTDAGSVDITGRISSGIYIDQESATSTLYLTNTNNTGITGILINAGTVVATNLGSIGDSGNAFPIDINNGSALTFTNSIQINTLVDISGGGTLNFAGDTQLRWGQGAVTADVLTLGAGDDLDLTGYNQNTNTYTSVSQNIQTLDLDNGGNYGRLIVGIGGQGYGFLGGIQQINVASGYILDFGGTYRSQSPAFNATVTNPIDVASGGALESRNSGTTTLTDVTLPLNGTFITGADDDGQGGSLVFSQDIVLPGTFNVAVNGYNENAVFSGKISGPGGFNFDGADANSFVGYEASTVWLTGTNSYSGPTLVTLATQTTTPYLAYFNNNDPNQPVFAPYASNQVALYISGDNSQTGSDYEVQGGSIVVDPAGKLPTDAVVALNGLAETPALAQTFVDTNPNDVGYGRTYVIPAGAKGVDAFAEFIVGDGNGAANVTIAGLSSGGAYIGGNYANSFIFGNVGNGYGGAATSVLTLDPGAGQVNEFQGQLGNGVTNGISTGFGNNYGNYYNNIEIVKTGAGTQWFTTWANNTYTGGTEIDGGTLAITGGDLTWSTSQNNYVYNVPIPVGGDYTLIASALGTGPITINNGATLEVAQSNGGLDNTVILGTPGTVTYDGDSYQAAGTIAGGGDYGVNGNFVGGGGLVVGYGDLLTSNQTIIGSPGNIYVVGGRLLMNSYGNTNFIDGATSVTTADGGILDFGTGNPNESLPIYFGANGAIEERQSNVVLNDVQPVVGTSGNMPVLTIGSDDVGSGSITITNSIQLASNIQVNDVQPNGRNYVAVNFTGGFSGTGNLTFGTANFANDYITQNNGFLTVSGPNTYTGDTIVTGGTVYLTGSSAGVHSAGGHAPNYYINVGSQTYVDDNMVTQIVATPGTLQIGSTGSLASDANVVMGGGRLVLGDGNGAISQTLGGLSSSAGGAGSFIYNGNTGSGAASSLTVDMASGSSSYAGTIGNNSAQNGNNLSFTKSGAGTLALNGANTYNGGTTVTGGRLAVNGSILNNAVVGAGAEVGGSGYIAGTISGAGAVGPGNSPGILTANQVDPLTNGSLSFNFEMTQAGAPTYGSSTASGNDVLHLLSSMPFVSPLTPLNAINVYFNNNGTFDGGFFVNGDADILTTNVALANFNYYVLDAAGNVTYNGKTYELASALGGTVSESVLAVSGAGFATGTTDGYEEQFVLVGAAVPEPSTFALMAVAGLAFLFVRRRIRS